MVVSESGSEYLCDVAFGTCECPDHEYRDEKCKHLHRGEFAMGERPIPTGADVDVDPQLGEHVSSASDEDDDGLTTDEIIQADDVEAVLDKYDPTVETDTDGDCEVATDGSAVVHAGEDCEVIETDDVFEGPFAEYDRYSHPTGEYYKRCNDCGREVLEDTPASAVSHRDGCRFGGDH